MNVPRSDRNVVYVEPFAGAAAVWLRLLEPTLTPPVAWQGGKRRLAPAILDVLGLTPRQPHRALLGDAGWWGEVWPLVVSPLRGTEVSRWLRSWSDEDPRELWFRLRSEGRPDDPVERAAGLLWLQARAASGVPVWWAVDTVDESVAVGSEQDADDVEPECYEASSGHSVRPLRRAVGSCAAPCPSQSRVLVKHPGHPGRKPGAVQVAGQKDTPALRAGARGDRPADSYEASQRTTRHDPPQLLQWASSKVDEAGQRNATEPRLRCDHRVTGHAKQGGILRTATVADRLDAIRLAARPLHRTVRDAVERGVRGCVTVRHFPEVHHARAEEWVVDAVREARAAGEDVRLFADPPYVGATGYEIAADRAAVLAIADACAALGARTVVSEAAPLHAELGRAWTAHRLTRPGGKPEWVTCYGCEEHALAGPLWARSA